MNHRCRRAYDHRIREQIVRSRNPDLFPELEIPRLQNVRRRSCEVEQRLQLVCAAGNKITARSAVLLFLRQW
jgi:hypothetical protein